MSKICNHEFRVLVSGDSLVGKTSLLQYTTHGGHMVDKSTIGVDFFTKVVDVKPQMKVRLHLWDTSGQERYRSIIRAYYRDVMGVMLVYDITKRSSFIHLEGWLVEAKLNILNMAVFTLVGHKADKDTERSVSREEGQAFANLHNMRFCETSAVDGRNVNETFLAIAQDIYILKEEGQVVMEDSWNSVMKEYVREASVKLCDVSKNKSKCCK